MSDDKRLERLEDKIDHIVDRLGSIDTTLAAQHVSLTEHMRRSDLLEQKMQPIEKNFAMLQGALKFLGLVTGITALIIGIKGLMK